MMGLSERASYFVLGLVIGLILGYIIKSLSDINRKVTEVDDLLHEHDPNDPVKRGPSVPRYDEGGFMRIPTWQEVKDAFNWRTIRERLTWGGVALFLVVVLTAYSAFQSQMNNNDLRDQTQVNAQQDRNDRAVVSCTVRYLGETLSAVNARTTYSGSQAEANIILQQAQAAFVEQALQEPALEATRVAQALRTYLAALEDFVELQKKSLGKQKTNPYPTEESFQDCLINEMRPK